MLTERRNTRTVKVGGIYIGSKYPVSIQSMTNTDTRDYLATLKQITRLEKAGCEIVRIAIPDMEAANNIKHIVTKSNIPVIADIHFDYKLALVAIKSGIHGIRINPGNIGSEDKIKIVAQSAGDAGIPIRIGANSGSLSKKFQFKRTDNLSNTEKILKLADALVDSAIEQCELLEKYGFNDIKVSLKASDTLTTIAAYRKFSKMTDYPLHLGVTEAGTQFQSTVKSSIGIGSLLVDGIGDTIRVSVTGPPESEIKIAKTILENCGHLHPCPEIISCPTCGRTEINLIKMVDKTEKLINSLKADGNKFKPSKIAVMGCAVNGPGEAKDADLGIAGAGKSSFILFKIGRTIGVFDESKAFHKLKEEIVKLLM